MENKDKKIKKNKKKPKFDIKKAGLNVDKAEYQEIVISPTNEPHRYF